MSQQHKNWKKSLAITFCDVLQSHQDVRVRWLSLLRAQTAKSGPAVPIAPADEPLVNKVERLVPDSKRFDAFITRLWLRVPEIFTIQDKTVVTLWLMETVINFQCGRYPDPLNPWVKPGRPRGGYRDDPAAFEELVIQIIRQLLRQGASPTQETVAQFLSATPGHAGMQPRALRKIIRRSWTILRDEARS